MIYWNQSVLASNILLFFDAADIIGRVAFENKSLESIAWTESRIIGAGIRHPLVCICTGKRQDTAS
jgi:hypothetical protein